MESGGKIEAFFHLQGVLAQNVVTCSKEGIFRRPSRIKIEINGLKEIINVEAFFPLYLELLEGFTSLFHLSFTC